MVAIDFKSVYNAWEQCKRRKGKSPQTQLYAVSLLDNLFVTLQLLQQNNWQPAPAICFVVHYPKAREVYAAHFSDRVVHHWLVPQLEQCYQNYFIHDVYSNLKGKGTHSAVKRLQKMMRSLHDRSPQVYFLQLDIANFFNSIDKPLLFKLLQRRLRQQRKRGEISQEKAKDLSALCHVLLKQDVASTARYYGEEKEKQGIPSHKKLINAGKNKGLPIGNLTSQFFANVYLNELDQYVKHQLKCQHYLRYVDDFILLHPDPWQLKQWHQSISQFLQQQLMLSLRNEVILQPISHGANFLGYIVRAHYCLVRRRVVGQLWQKLQKFERQYIRGSLIKGWHIQLSITGRDQLQAQLASYLGHFKHASHYHLLNRMLQRFCWLACLFNLSQCRLFPLWKPKLVKQLC